MSPEVLLGEAYNESADIFSLAVVLYEIFTKCNTAYIVVTSGGPHEAEHYAYKVWLRDEGMVSPRRSLYHQPLRINICHS